MSNKNPTMSNKNPTMSNMSYCRFENTYNDLMDCYDNIDDEKDLSYSEAKHRLKLISLCKDIAEDYSE